MPTTYSNWVYDNKTTNEKDNWILEKAKRREAEDEKNGYRWIKINPRNRIFVPCDKNGKPTKDGQRKIEILKQYLGIK